LVIEISLYYDARSKKHQITTKIYLYFWSFKAFLEIQCLTSPTIFYMLPTPFNYCNSAVVEWRGSGKIPHGTGHWGGGGGAGDGRYIATSLRDCHWALLTVISNAILIGNLSCCKVINCCRMKDMKIVLISRFCPCGVKTDGDKLFRSSIGYSCPPEVLESSWIKVFTIGPFSSVQCSFFGLKIVILVSLCTHMGSVTVNPYGNRQSCLKRKPREVQLASHGLRLRK
jgi:hypothetical protein